MRHAHAEGLDAVAVDGQLLRLGLQCEAVGSGVLCIDVVLGPVAAAGQ